MIFLHIKKFFPTSLAKFFSLISCGSVLTLTLTFTSIFSCSQTPPPADGTVLQVWGHAGRQSEREVLQHLVKTFNTNQDSVEIELTLLPEGSYNSQVQAAALAGDLPHILEFDGPYMYNYMWQGHLLPLDSLISRSVLKNVIPSVLKQGTYREKLYTLGMFDAGLALYGRRSRLEAVGARIPHSPANAWTIEEFDKILKDLADQDPDGQVLDLKMNYRGEWFTFAFMPPLISGGADVINRDSFQSATGSLNSPEAVKVMTYFQSWIHDEKRVDMNVDDYAFVGGRVALSWVGHWEYPRYHQAWGEDLVLIPLPDFEHGSKTGQGSWSWGMTRKCPYPQMAARFIEFLLEDSSIVAMTDANGAVPATYSALEASRQYQKGSPLRLFARQLTEGYAVPRPRTPAYPVITTVFQQAFLDISHGAKIQQVLNRATQEINLDIKDNQGYPMVNHAY